MTNITNCKNVCESRDDDFLWPPKLKEWMPKITVFEKTITYSYGKVAPIREDNRIYTVMEKSMPAMF